MPEKKFSDGVGFNKFWPIYFIGPYLAGAIATYAHKFHAFSYIKLRELRTKAKSYSELDKE